MLPNLEIGAPASHPSAQARPHMHGRPSQEELIAMVHSLRGKLAELES